MAEDYQVQNVYNYTRKSFKSTGRRVSHDDNEMLLPLIIDDLEVVQSPQCSPRVEDAACSCDDHEGNIAHILHKKCPVISLAQQQLHRLMIETDQMFSENPRCCRTIYDFLYMLQEIIRSQNRSLCFLLILATVMFCMGSMVGAASCGSTYRKFNSPIMTCLDNLFTFDYFYGNKKEYYGIV